MHDTNLVQVEAGLTYVESDEKAFERLQRTVGNGVRIVGKVPVVSTERI